MFFNWELPRLDIILINIWGDPFLIYKEKIVKIKKKYIDKEQIITIPISNEF